MSWSVTEGFKAALRGSHTPTMRVEILEGGSVIASTDNLVLGEQLNVLEGSISEDRKAQVRRQASWTLVDRYGLFGALGVDDYTYPLRDRDVRLWRGIGDELVPKATVQLTSLSVSADASGTTYAMAGSDRTTLLSQADWRQELEIMEGMTPHEATDAILAQVDPGHLYSVVGAPTTKTLDEMVFLPGEAPNPWEAIVKIWESAAMEVFIDALGQVKAQPFVDPATAPISWQFIDDEDSIRVAPLQVQVNRTTLRNGVIVQGSAPWLLYGVSAEAWDLDVNSSTYYDPANPSASLVGPRPQYIEDSLVSDESEAQALANAKLPDVLGIEEQVSFSAVPNPALEAGDVVEIATPVTGGASRFVLDQLTTPLTYVGTQTANTRRRNR